MATTASTTMTPTLSQHVAVALLLTMPCVDAFSVRANNQQQFAPLFQAQQRQPQRTWLSKFRDQATQAIGMASISVALLQGAVVPPAHASVVVQQQQAVVQQAVVQQEESVDSILSHARSVLADFDDLLRDDVENDIEHDVENDEAEDAYELFLQHSAHGSEQEQHADMIDISSSDNDFDRHDYGWDASFDALLAEGNTATIQTSIPAASRSALKQHPTLDDSHDSDVEEDIDGRTASSWSRPAFLRRSVMEPTPVMKHHEGTSQQQQQPEMLASTTNAQQQQAQQQQQQQQETNTASTTQEDVSPMMRRISLTTPQLSTRGGDSSILASTSTSTSTTASHMMKRVAAGGALVSVRPIATETPVTLSDEWMEEFHCQTKDFTNVETTLVPETNIAQQLAAAGPSGGDGSYDHDIDTVDAGPISRVRKLFRNNPRLSKGIAFVAAGTAGVMVGKAVYNNWFKTARTESVVDATTDDVTEVDIAVEAQTIQEQLQTTTPIRTIATNALDRIKGLPSIISNTVVANREMQDATNLPTTVAAVTLGGGVGLFMTRKEHAATSLMEADDDFLELSAPAQTHDAPTSDVSVDDIQKRGWSKIFGAPNPQIMTPPAFVATPQQEQYPLMDRDSIRARQQPKPKRVERSLAQRYGQIEDVGDRAFQILLDLGMIQTTTNDDVVIA